MESVHIVSVIGGPTRNDPRDWLSLQINYPPGAHLHAVALPDYGRMLRYGVPWRASRGFRALFNLACRWAEPNRGRKRGAKRSDGKGRLHPAHKWYTDRGIPHRLAYRRMGSDEGRGHSEVRADRQSRTRVGSSGALWGSGYDEET